jgi:hypothetical protein
MRGLLKGILTSLVSGITVQVNDDEPTATLRAIEAIHPTTGKRSRLGRHRIETPGGDYLPPLAASVTAAARMLLCLAVAMLRNRGGRVVYVDTDGIDVDIDATAADRVRWQLEALLDVPDDTRGYVYSTDDDGNWVRLPEPRILRSEPENRQGPCGLRSDLRAAVLAAKKHHPYRAYWCGAHVEITEDGPVVVGPTDLELSRPVELRIVRPSWHQLEVHAPASTLIEGMEHLLRQDWEMPTTEPEGWAEPAFVLVPAASVDLINDLHPGVPPFSHLAVARMATIGNVTIPWHPGFDPSAAGWKDGRGSEFSPFAPGRPYTGETVGHFQRKAWRAFDRRMVDADGAPIGPTTLGEVDYGPTIASRMEATGKESRALGIGRGLLFPPDTAIYLGDDPAEMVHRAASRLSKETEKHRRMEELSGMSERGFRAYLSGERAPERSTFEAILQATAQLAAQEIRRIDTFGELPEDDIDTIARYLAEVPEPVRRCQGPDCGKALIGRQRYWCGDACRKAFERQPDLPFDP